LSRKVTAVLMLTLLFSCAKYSFRGALPSNLKTVYIEDFKDNTNYPGVFEEFMQKVTSAFISDNSLRVVEQKTSADLILSGTLTSIQRRPVSITPTEQVQQYQMVLTVRTECMNSHTQKPLWSESISRYGIISGNATRDEIDQANSLSIDQVVEDIIAKTIGAW
jgi:outer membrane lipopolysaccharide assembly protein LptE/RlpB